jgi:hypothetical protein
MTVEKPSFLRQEIAERRLVTMIAFAYSLIVVVTIIPSFSGRLLMFVLVPYYLVVPGYCVTLLFGEDYDRLQRLLFSVLASMSLFLCLSALKQVNSSLNIPSAISLPAISIGIIIYGYYFHRW